MVAAAPQQEGQGKTHAEEKSQHEEDMVESKHGGMPFGRHGQEIEGFHRELGGNGAACCESAGGCPEPAADHVSIGGEIPSQNGVAESLIPGKDGSGQSDTNTPEDLTYHDIKTGGGGHSVLFDSDHRRGREGDENQPEADSLQRLGHEDIPEADPEIEPGELPE